VPQPRLGCPSAIAPAEALRRSGGHAALLRGFLGPGRDFLPALLLRFLEVRRLLPARLRSDPAV